MPRPNRDRIRVTLFLGRTGVEACTELAKERGVPVGDIYRAVFAAGFPIVKKEGNPK